jgi:cytoskeletal protein CcmA (bactofilin family)
MALFKKEEMQENQLSNSLLGRGAVIKGDINTEGDIRIEGKVFGNIKFSGKLVIGDGAEIKGDINANHLEVYGKVKGKLVVNEFLAIKGNGLGEGELFASKLHIEPTAFFKGISHMNEPANIIDIKKDELRSISEIKSI